MWDAGWDVDGLRGGLGWAVGWVGWWVWGVEAPVYDHNTVEIVQPIQQLTPEVVEHVRRQAVTVLRRSEQLFDGAT